MILGKLDQDVAVLRADRARIVVDGVDRAHRQADIIDDRDELFGRDDLADAARDAIELRGRILDA
jgi:hypothetical protein